MTRARQIAICDRRIQELEERIMELREKNRGSGYLSENDMISMLQTTLESWINHRGMLESKKEN